MGTVTLLFPLVAAVAIACILGKMLNSMNASRRPLPPGPKGIPLLGNIFDLPPSGELEAKHWLKHKELYGPISSVTVLGQTIIIVNDADVAVELLERRSVKHSSRPRQVFAGEMLGWENSLGLSQYNDRFRTYRRNMSRIIGSKQAVSHFAELQEAEVGHFLLHVLDSPEKLTEHIRHEIGAVILKIAYGYTAEPHKNDLLIDMAGDAMDKFAQAGVPGAFVVDMLPFFRSLPDGFPGTGFKHLARQWGAELRDVTEKPYAFVKHQMASGKPQNSFLSRLIEAGDETPFEKFTNKWSAMSLYTAGADTTVAALSSFFMAMTVYPEVQRKAQEEIEHVIGQNRLPNSADRENLPFVDAIVKEVLRWHPVAPMSLPHTSTEDDIYEGYFVPKEAMIMANVWHFTHDPTRYPDPMSFKPERFLKAVDQEPAPDPQFVFGFGRRICPGRILADNALFLNIAQFLAVFNIGKPLDANGGEVEPEVSWMPGVVSHPAPYSVAVRPRSKTHEQLIKAVEQKYPWQESDAKVLGSIGY